ncbi:hypothetical protein M5689_020288 [Euphorbia peplus]|nr:hypothetical protein M5689_020288 [Euphorbia peplus]
MEMRIDRKSSIETEPRTLPVEQLEYAREAAIDVMNTRSLEEAVTIFTKGLEPVVSRRRTCDDLEKEKQWHQHQHHHTFRNPNSALREILSAPF